MAFARRILAVLIAAAVALAPVGAASAANMRAAPAAPHQAQAMHHGHGHDHAAMQVAMAADHGAAHHCKGSSVRACCCDDKGTCAQTCLQKCFGQIALLPPERTARIALAFRIAPRPAERPPGWSSAPQLPPPRT